MLSGLIPPTTNIGTSLGSTASCALSTAGRGAFGGEEFERGRAGIERGKGFGRGEIAGA